MTATAPDPKRLAALLSMACHPDTPIHEAEAARKKAWSAVKGDFSTMFSKSREDRDADTMYDAYMRASDTADRWEKLHNLLKSDHHQTVTNYQDRIRKLNQQIKELSMTAQHQPTEAEMANALRESLLSRAAGIRTKVEASLAEAKSFEDAAASIDAVRTILTGRVHAGPKVASPPKPKAKAKPTVAKGATDQRVFNALTNRWMTVGEFITATGLTRNTCRKSLDGLVSRGEAQRKEGPLSYRLAG